MKPIRVGVVGLGVMGRQHLRVLRGLVEFDVVAIADPRIGDYDTLAECAAGISIHCDPEELLGHDLDAVVIASPTSLHVPQATYFLQAGVHVLLEKPIAPDIASARTLVQVARRSHARLLIGHIERFNPAIDALQSLIAGGNLGRVLSISARRVGVARPALPATNVIADLGIHDIDIIQLLTGSEPVVLGATGGSLPGNHQEDFAFVLLSYGDVAAAVETNWITPLKSRRLSVTGTGGFVDLDYVRQEVTVYEGRIDPVDNPTAHFSAVWQTAQGRPLWVLQGEPLMRELLHFAECVRGHSEPAVSCEEALAALAACQRATDWVREAQPKLVATSHV
ncbi:MAG: Gfo/Idh/MocA family oxidoreductase [Acidobacteria bacterium]|nr:Gfo/Idh/MocA family oxidoreductase [Acidobacteriota bacterium]